MKLRLRKYMRCLIMIFVVVLLLHDAIQARTIEKNAQENVCITLQNRIGKSTYSLYRVADYSETGEFKLEKSFAEYPVNLEGLDHEGWRALANTLQGYVERDKIPTFDKKETNEEGYLRWENIPKGLYLILGNRKVDEEYAYTQTPILITAPNLETNGEWNYQLFVKPKFNKEDITKKVDRRIIKIWKDTPGGKIPNKIDVELLKDGKVYDTVELNNKNQWQYEWKNLSEKYEWKVVEREVPKDFTVTSIQESLDFVITNTYNRLKPNEKLPLTGQLWWPVLVCAVIGFGFLFYGVVKKRK